MVKSFVTEKGLSSMQRSFAFCNNPTTCHLLAPPAGLPLQLIPVFLSTLSLLALLSIQCVPGESSPLSHGCAGLGSWSLKELVGRGEEKLCHCVLICLRQAGSQPLSCCAGNGSSTFQPQAMRWETNKNEGCSISLP